MVERGGGGRPPPTAQSASTRSAGRLRRSSVDDIAQSLVPGFLDVNGAGIILPAPPRECGARLPHAMSEAAAAAACAPHSAASAAATQLLSMLSRTRGELASTRGPFDPDVPNRLAQRLAAARAELRVVRARVVPAALVLAALLLGVGAGLGGWLDAKSVLAAPLVLSLCAPGAVCALLAILPSEPAAARGAALGCALALALVATAAMWDVSERAVQISAARQCELPEPSRSLAQVPPRARWAYVPPPAPPTPRALAWRAGRAPARVAPAPSARPPRRTPPHALRRAPVCLPICGVCCVVMSSRSRSVARGRRPLAPSASRA